MTDILLRVDADTQAYEAKIRGGLGGAHEQVTRQIEKHGGAMHTLEHGLNRAIARTFALKEMFEKAGEAAMKLAERQIAADKKSGAATVQSGAALMQLGYSGQQLERIQGMVENAPGVAGEQERAGFLEKLASEQNRRRKEHLPLMDSRQTISLLGSYIRGGDVAFGKGGEDLSAIASNPMTMFGDYGEAANDVAARNFGLKPGTPDAIRKGLAGMPESMKKEVTSRMLEFENERRSIEARRERGGGLRRAQSALEANYAENPLGAAAMDYVGSLPVVGKIAERVALNEQEWIEGDPNSRNNATLRDIHETLIETKDATNHRNMRRTSAGDERDNGGAP